MSELSIFHWMVVLAIFLLLFFGKRIFPPLDKGPRGGPPTHPIPATGPIETSSSPKSADDDPNPKPSLRASKH